MWPLPHISFCCWVFILLFNLPSLPVGDFRLSFIKFCCGDILQFDADCSLAYFSFSSTNHLPGASSLWTSYSFWVGALMENWWWTAFISASIKSFVHTDFGVRGGQLSNQVWSFQSSLRATCMCQFSAVGCLYQDQSQSVVWFFSAIGFAVEDGGQQGAYHAIWTLQQRGRGRIGVVYLMLEFLSQNTSFLAGWNMSGA